MSFNLQLFNRLEGLIDGQKLELGSIEIPVSVTVTGNVHRRTETLATNTNATMYSDELGDFSVLVAASDLNTRLLLTDTQSNTFCVQLRGSGTANKYGTILMLPLDETSNATTTINSVAAFNDGTDTAKVTVLVIE